MLTVYGLKNCDTCRNALKWLTQEGIDHTFYDVRKDGINENDVNRWVRSVGWESLLNRRGTTWRNLAEDTKSSINEENAKGLMLEQPAMIKRPVFVTDNSVICGFKDAEKTFLKNL